MDKEVQMNFKARQRYFQSRKTRPFQAMTSIIRKVWETVEGGPVFRLMHFNPAEEKEALGALAKLGYPDAGTQLLCVIAERILIFLSA